MVWLIPTIIASLLIIFWLWMYWDMTNNPALSKCYITFTNGNNPKYDWTVAFVILNVLTAGYYYFTEYRK